MSIKFTVLRFVFVIAVYTIPFVFRWFPSIERSFIFQPRSDIPKNLDFKHPENSGFVGGRNFYLKTKDGATLGVWHTLPSNLESEVSNSKVALIEENTAPEIYNKWMADATVFLYVHGTAGPRTSPHRLRVYQLLNKLNYHVVAFDYRGYGDSTGSPISETNVVEDTLTVYAWIKERVVLGEIFLWGHSLGTGVAAHACETIVNRGEEIKGIVLEAPYNNMADVIRSSSLTTAVSFLPWFDYFCIQPLYKNDLSFESDKHLKTITTPVLILHAMDDPIIPYKLGAKLSENVAGSRKDADSVKLVSYKSELGYGHYNIGLDPNLNVIVNQFVNK